MKKNGVVSIMKKILWIKVTQDKYELPLAVTDTAQEMADLNNISVQAVKASAWSYKADRRKFSSYRSVRIDEDETD